MWFINGKRQTVEGGKGTQEKRARRVATRPEPTINLWQLLAMVGVPIVGKTATAGSTAARHSTGTAATPPSAGMDSVFP
jgi:hypothetical protein